MAPSHRGGEDQDQVDAAAQPRCAINERILISTFRGVRVRRGGSARASEDEDGRWASASRASEPHESPNFPARDARSSLREATIAGKVSACGSRHVRYNWHNCPRNINVNNSRYGSTETLVLKDRSSEFFSHSVASRVRLSAVGSVLVDRAGQT